MYSRLPNNRRALLLIALFSLTIFMIGGCSSQKGTLPAEQPISNSSSANEPVQAAPTLKNDQTTGSGDSTQSGEDAEAVEPGHVLTMEECVRIALKRSPAVDNAIMAVESAKWSKRKASKDFLPTVGLQYTYTWLDETPMQSGLTVPGLFSIPPYQVGSRDNFKLTTTVSQNVFTGFATTSAYNLSKLGLDVAEIQKIQEKMDLILKVKQAYYGILQAGKAVEVAKQSEVQLKAHLREAKSFFEVGMVPKNEVLQAEVRLAEAVQSRIEAEFAVKNAQAGMNVLLRRDINAPLYVEDVLAYKPYTTTLGECMTRALVSRPEISIAKKQISMKDQETRLARSEYYPKVSVSYNQTKEGDTWDVSGGKYHEPNAWNVVAAAQWTVWQWGKSRDGVKVSKIEKSRAKNTLVQIKDGVQLEVKESYLSLQAAEQAIFVTEKAVEQAEENFRMSQERYREQVATATEVTDAETLLTSARTNHYNSLYQFNLAAATLERAMGANKFIGGQEGGGISDLEPVKE